MGYRDALNRLQPVPARDTYFGSGHHLDQSTITQHANSQGQVPPSDIELKLQKGTSGRPCMRDQRVLRIDIILESEPYTAIPFQLNLTVKIIVYQCTRTNSPHPPPWPCMLARVPFSVCSTACLCAVPR